MKNIFLIIILLIGNFTFSQVFISDTKDSVIVKPKALIEFSSIERGILLPRLTTVQRENMFKGITTNSSHISMMVYDNDLEQFMYWNGISWQPIFISENFNYLTNLKLDDKSLNDTILSLRKGIFDSLQVSGKTRLGYKKIDSTIIFNPLRIRDLTIFNKNIYLKANLVRDIGRAEEENDAINLRLIKESIKFLNKISLKTLKDSAIIIRESVKHSDVTFKSLSDSAKIFRKGKFEELNIFGKIQLGKSTKDSTIIYNTFISNNIILIKDTLGVGTNKPKTKFHIEGHALIDGNLSINDTVSNIDSIKFTTNDKNFYLVKNSTSDLISNGGGIILKGASDKSIIWTSGLGSWNLSENINIPLGKEYMINNQSINKSKVLSNVVYLDTKNEFLENLIINDSLVMSGNRIVQVGYANTLTDAVNLKLLNDSLKQIRNSGVIDITFKVLSDTTKAIRDFISKSLKDTTEILKISEYDSLSVLKKVRLGTSKEDSTIVYNRFSSKGVSIFNDYFGIGLENPEYPFHLRGYGKITGDLNLSNIYIDRGNIYLGDGAIKRDSGGIILNGKSTKNTILLRKNEINTFWNSSDNINLSMGKEFLINNRSINKSRVLTNVAYLDTTNTFSKSISINDTLSMNNNRITKLARAKDSLDAVNLITLKDSLKSAFKYFKPQDNILLREELVDSVKSIKKGKFDSLLVKRVLISSRFEIDSSKISKASINIMNSNLYGVYKDGDLAYKGDCLLFMNKDKEINLLSSLDFTEKTSNYSGLTSIIEIDTNVNGEIGIPLYLNKITKKYYVASNTNDSSFVLAVTLDASKTQFRKVLKQGYLYNSNWNFSEIGKPVFLGKDGKLNQTKSEIIGEFVQQIGSAISKNILYFKPLKRKEVDFFEPLKEISVSINQTGLKIIKPNESVTYTVQESQTALNRKWYYSRNSTGPFINELPEGNGSTSLTTNQFSSYGKYYIVCISSFSGGYEKESEPARLIVCENKVTPSIDQLITPKIFGNVLKASVLPLNNVTYSWRYDNNIDGTFENIISISDSCVPSFDNKGNYYIKCIATIFSEVVISSNLVKIIVNSSTLEPTDDQIIRMGTPNTVLKQYGIKLTPLYFRYSTDINGPFENEISNLSPGDSLLTSSLPSGINYVVATNDNIYTNPVKITVVEAQISPIGTQHISKKLPGNKLTATINPNPDSRDWYWGTSRDNITSFLGKEDSYIPKDIQNDSFFVVCKAKYGSTEFSSNIVKILTYDVSIKDNVKEKFVKVNTTKDTIKALWTNNPTIVWQVKHEDGTTYSDVNSYTTINGDLVTKQSTYGTYFYRAKMNYNGNYVYSDSVRVEVCDININYTEEAAYLINEDLSELKVNVNSNNSENITYQWYYNETLDITGATDSSYKPNFASIGDYKIWCRICYSSNFTGENIDYYLFTDTAKYSIIKPTFTNTTKQVIYQGKNCLPNNISEVSDNVKSKGSNWTWILKNITKLKNYTQTGINFNATKLDSIGIYKLFYEFTYKSKQFNSDTVTIVVGFANIKEDNYFKSFNDIIDDKTFIVKTSICDLGDFVWKLRDENTLYDLPFIINDYKEYTLYYFNDYYKISHGVIYSDSIKIKVNTGLTMNYNEGYGDYDYSKQETNLNNQIQVVGYDNSEIEWYYSTTIDGPKVLMTKLSGTNPIYKLYFNRTEPTYYISAKGTLNSRFAESPAVKINMLDFRISSNSMMQAKFDYEDYVFSDYIIDNSLNIGVDAYKWYYTENGGAKVYLVVLNTNKYTPSLPSGVTYGEFKLGCEVTYKGLKIEPKFQVEQPPIFSVIHFEITPNHVQYLSTPSRMQGAQLTAKILPSYLESKINIAWKEFHNVILDKFGFNFTPDISIFNILNRELYVYCQINYLNKTLYHSQKVNIIAPVMNFSNKKSYYEKTDIITIYRDDFGGHTEKWEISRNGDTFFEIANFPGSQFQLPLEYKDDNVIYLKFTSTYHNDDGKGDVVLSDYCQIGRPAAGNEIYPKPQSNSVVSVYIDNEKYDVYYDGEFTYFSETPNNSIFTCLNGTGAIGPNNISYSIPLLAKYVSISNEYQFFTVPVLATYELIVAGASGGTCKYYNNNGGKGMGLKMLNYFNRNDKLKIIVGQKGLDSRSESFEGAGGGGATLVYNMTQDYLSIIAGGGGGGGKTIGVDGSLFESGTLSFKNNTSTYAGSGDGGGGSEYTGGGAGYYSDGQNGTNTETYGIGGGKLNSDGKGGLYVYNNIIKLYTEILEGGFGGGGAACFGIDGDGGGGGGYGGGAPGYDFSGGGGGGSFHINSANEINKNSGNGYIIIKYKTN